MRIKPGRWSANPADVAPEFQDLWKGLIHLIPFWGESPEDLIPTNPPLLTSANGVVEPKSSGLGHKFITDSDIVDLQHRFTADIGSVMVVWEGVNGGGGTTISRKLFATENDDTGLQLTKHGTSYNWEVQINNDGANGFNSFFSPQGDWPIGSASSYDGRTHVVLVSWVSEEQAVSLWWDGKSFARRVDTGWTDFGEINTGGGVLSIGNRNYSAFRPLDGHIFAFAGWDRALTDGEARLLSQDPFGLFRPHIPLNDDAIAILDLTDTTVQNGYLQAADTTHTLLQSGVATESAIPHPTTSLDIRLDVDLKSLTAGRIVAGAHNDSAGTREVVLSLESGNTFQAHPNNDTAWNPAGTYWRTGRFQYRFLWSGTTWTAYYRSADGLPLSSDIGWTTHASTTKNNISGLTDVANTPFTLMRRYTGTGWSAADWYGFQIAIDGTVESSWKGGAVELGASSFTDEQGLTWTWTGTAPTKEGSFGTADSAAITVRARGVDVNPVGHMVFNGTDYVETTDKAILDLTGDIEVIWVGTIDDTTNWQGMIAKGDPNNTTDSWAFARNNSVNDATKLRFHWRENGTTQYIQESATGMWSPFPRWYRASVDMDNGSSQHVTTFYISDDHPKTPVDEVSWTQWSQHTVANASAIQVGTDPVRIGYNESTDQLVGKGYGAWVINGLNGSAQVGGVYHDGTGDYITTTDKAALDITGDIDLRCLVTPDVWVPSGADQDLISKASGAAGNRSYRLRLNTTGDITLLWSTDGTNYTTQASDPHGFTAGPRWLRATMDVDNGSSQRVITFYTSNDSPSTPRSLVTWELLSQHTVSGTTSIFSGAAALNLGTLAGTSNDFTGLIHYAEVRNGINGTIVADPDYRGGDITADASGNTWTKNGNAYWTGPVLQADFRTKRPSFLYLDGNDDAETPDKSSFQITDMESVFLLAAADYTPSTNAFPFGQYNATGDQRSWRSQLTNTGQVTFVWSADGINTNNEFGDTLVSDLVPNGHHIWLRVNWDVDNGASNYDGYFHYSLDPINTPIDEVKWIQIGSVEQGAGTTSFFNSTATLKIGQTFTGKIYGAWLNNNGAWVASIDYRDRDMVVDGQGNVWTKNGSVWREWGDANFGINEYTLNGNTYWDTDAPLTLTAQIIQNDQVTPLTDEVVVVELVEDTDWQDYQVLFSGIDQTADKTVWDNAKMRLRWSSDG